MTSLIAAAVEPATPSLGATPATRHLVLAPVPEVGRPNPAPQAQPQPALTALSRVRGGMYSSTVDLIRFADGSTAHTDLIRLNPNIDAYSLDFAGISPRRLAHYREEPWQQASHHSAATRREITEVLANSYPAVSTAELTRRLRERGHNLGTAEIRRHEAIAATQAAIWHLTDGLELDTQPLDRPVSARARIGEHPSARPVGLTDGRLDWHTPLPAGETVYLELTLADALQLRSFSFTVGSRAGRHEVEIRLEKSTDGQRWSPVSRSAVTLADRRPYGRRWNRPLGLAATLASANAAAGYQGHRHYRLAATGPADRDGLLDLRGIALEIGNARRYRNNERVVHLYELLLDQAADTTLPAHHAHARLLIGSSTPTGPSEYTPVVALALPRASAPSHRVVPVQPGLSIPGLNPSAPRPNQESTDVR